MLRVHICGGNLTVLRLLEKFYVVGKIDVEPEFIHLDFGLCRSRVCGWRRLMVFSQVSLVRRRVSGRLGGWNSRHLSDRVVRLLSNQVVRRIILLLSLRLTHPFEMIRLIEQGWDEVGISYHLDLEC